MKIRIDGQTIETSNDDKPMFPDADVTKADVVRYYRDVAPRMLPAIEGRPLTLQRFPDGIEEKGFYQQNRPEHFPEHVGGVRARRVGGGDVDHVLAEDAAALVYLADQATLAFHAWTSRHPDLDRPDRLLLDLDPPGEAAGTGGFGTVRRAARAAVRLLRDCGVTPFVMTTGSRGAHVVVPLDANADFDRVREVGRDVAGRLAERHADWLTVEQRKDARAGRLYVDTTRNAWGQTGVAPYSLRALPGAPVATPLDVQELQRGDLQAQTYHIGNIRRRLGQKRDPWSGIDRHRASIETIASGLRNTR